MNRTMVRALAASGAAVAMVAAGALPSTARTVVDRVPGEYGGIFYDNVATGTGQPDLILFADASPEDRCNRTPVSFENRVRAFGEEGTPGARLNLSFVKRVPLWLYHGQGLSAPDFVGAYCAALGGAGDVPEPIGVGKGLLQEEIAVEWLDAGPPSSAVETNSAKGSVKTPEGERLVVRGEAVNALTGPGVGIPVDVSVEVLNR